MAISDVIAIILSSVFNQFGDLERALLRREEAVLRGTGKWEIPAELGAGGAYLI